MAASGKGDYPFRSVWLERTGVYGGTYLRKTIIPGHGTDAAGRTVWSDWFFGAARSLLFNSRTIRNTLLRM